MPTSLTGISSKCHFNYTPVKKGCATDKINFKRFYFFLSFKNNLLYLKYRPDSVLDIANILISLYPARRR